MAIKTGANNKIAHSRYNTPRVDKLREYEGIWKLITQNPPKNKYTLMRDSDNVKIVITREGLRQ